MKYKRIKLIHRNIIQKREKRQIKWYHILISLFVILITLVQIKLHLFHKKSLTIKGGAFINQINYTDVITNYFGKLPKKFQSAINHELWLYRKYMRLKTLSPNKSSSSDQRAKIELYHSLGGKKYTKRKNIYIRDSWRFGNRMIMLSNMVYYIELLGEKKNIYINNAHHWFFKDKIVTDYVNIEMVNDTQMNCNDSETYCIQGCPWLLTPQVIWPEIRMKVFKNELMKNLPKVKTSPKDLYIHIRSGDIYSSYYVHRSYPQPPLCFYKSILNHNKYRNAYIITENNKSPIIKKLVKEYPQIILNFNSLRNDLAVLINSYNLVGSVSSFVQVCLMLNDNIENYFEYDIYRKLEKFRHLHHDCYKYPRKFNIYKMKPSEYYKGEMYLWVNSPNQIKIMMEENCTYSDFQLTKN
jgi:hypothetical protein